MAEKITRSVRADESTFGRLAELAKAEFGEGGQGAALEALLNLWDVQKAKTGIAGRQTEIENFDAHLQALQRGFLAALEVGQDAETRARQDFRAELENQSAEINRLKEETELAKQEARTERKQKDGALSDAIKYAEAKETADAKAAAAIDAANAQRERADHLEKSLINAKKRIENLEAEVAGYQAELIESEDAKTDAQNKTENLKKQIAEMDAAAAIAKANAEAEKAVAIGKAREDDFNKIMALMNEIADLKTQLAEAVAQNKKTAAGRRGRPPKKTMDNESNS